MRPIHPAPAQAPPEAWPPAHRAVRRLARPVESFLATEVASGIVLLAVTALALAWANSPWRASYEALLDVPLGVRAGSFVFEEPLRFWIDDGLMTLFFFVVGLEVRREIARGELRGLRRAALPVAAALGGMVVPAVIFGSLNLGRASANGWGIPMATDIAFAVGVLAVLGDRVPPALRILLLSLAVIDDIGAVVVIGLFYSTGFAPSGLVVATLALATIFVMQRLGVRRPWLYVAPAIVLWIGLHHAGIHATIAGVLVGLATPTRAWFGRSAFVDVVGHVVDEVRAAAPDIGDDADIGAHLDVLHTARREAMAPVDYLEHALHRVVAFGVMPLFALANAGVALDGVSIDRATLPLLAGVVLGLVIGKPLGIVAGAWLAVRARVAALPEGVTWAGVLVVGIVGGIGFTMSIFIAELAFGDRTLAAAKLAVLVGSLIAAAGGLVAGRVALPKAPAP